jgi:iron(III) transport system permease protein
MCRIDRNDGSRGKRDIFKIDHKYWLSLGIFFTITLLPFAAIILNLFSGSLSEFSFSSLHLLKNSALVAVLTTVIAVFLGIPYALLAGKTSLPHRNLWLSFALLPLLIPGYVKTVGWITILGKGGYLTQLLHIHIDMFNVYGTAFILGTTYFPIVVFMLAFPLNFMNPAYEEAGSLQHSTAKVLRHITLPLVRNSLFVSMLLVFILAFTNFSVPVHLGVNVYAVEVFSYFEAFYDHNFVFLSSIPVIASLLPVFVIAGLFSAKIPKSTIAEKYESHRLTLKSHIPALVILIFVLLVTLIAPVVCLFLKTNGIVSFFSTFSVAGHEIINSLVFSFIATIIILLLAFGIASCLLRAENFYFLLLPLLLPGTLMAIGLIKVMNHSWLQIVYTSPIMLILSYVIRFLPIAVVGFVYYMKKIHPSMIEAGSLQHSALRISARIILPLTKNGIVLVGFIVFAFCLGELDATALLTSPGNVTIPLHIFNLMHYGADNIVASLCLIIILTIACILFIMTLVRRYAFRTI